MSIINSIKNHPVTTTIVTGVAYPLKGIAKGYDFYNRQIENLTKKTLPPTAAKVVQEFARSLPFTLAYLAAIIYLPGAIFLPAAIVTMIVTTQLNLRQRITWLNAQGMSELVLSAKALDATVTCGYPATAGFISVIFLMLAVYDFYRAHTLYPKLEANAPLLNPA